MSTSANVADGRDGDERESERTGTLGLVVQLGIWLIPITFTNIAI